MKRNKILFKSVDYENINHNLLTGWNSIVFHKSSENIIKCPDIIKNHNYSKLSGFGWAWLLRVHSQFANYCNWSKLDKEDWFWLLEEQPQFIKYGNITKK